MKVAIIIVLTIINSFLAYVVYTKPPVIEQISIESVLVRHETEIATVRDKLDSCINDLSWWKKESANDYIFTEDRCVCVTYDNEKASSREGVLSKQEICGIGN